MSTLPFQAEVLTWAQKGARPREAVFHRKHGQRLFLWLDRICEFINKIYAILKSYYVAKKSKNKLYI
jgi:hypothetical protein